AWRTLAAVAAVVSGEASRGICTDLRQMYFKSTRFATSIAFSRLSLRAVYEASPSLIALPPVALSSASCARAASAGPNALPAQPSPAAAAPLHCKKRRLEVPELFDASSDWLMVLATSWFAAWPVARLGRGRL